MFHASLRAAEKKKKHVKELMYDCFSDDLLQSMNINNLTMPMQKSVMTGHGLSTTHSMKADLIQHLNEYLWSISTEK